MQIDDYTEVMSDLSHRHQEILKLLKNNNDKIQAGQLRRELGKVKKRIRRGMDYEYEGTFDSGE